MEYRAVEPMTRQEAEENLASGEINLMCATLVSIAFYDEDADWVERVCTEFLAHPDSGIRAISCTCLGHLARIHGDPKLARVRPGLKQMLKDPEVASYAEDALGDIDVYLGPEAGRKQLRH